MTALALVMFASCWETNSAPPPPLGVPAGTVTDVDGNVYQTVNLGGQIWMAENLKTTHYNDGSPILLVEDPEPWTDVLAHPAYCWYDNDPANKDVYGALYNWKAVDTRKLCPTGWFVPSSKNWEGLFKYLGGSVVAGGKLKEAGANHWQSPNTGATNESGFTALPAGQHNVAGTFSGIGKESFWWCSDTKLLEIEPASYFAYATYDKAHSSTSDGYPWAGFSVRCMRSAP